MDKLRQEIIDLLKELPKDFAFTLASRGGIYFVNSGLLFARAPIFKQFGDRIVATETEETIKAFIDYITYAVLPPSDAIDIEICNLLNFAKNYLVSDLEEYLSRMLMRRIKSPKVAAISIISSPWQRDEMIDIGLEYFAKCLKGEITTDEQVHLSDFTTLGRDRLLNYLLKKAKLTPVIEEVD